MNLSTQLQRQLDFLKRSCDLYDSGHKEESIRIAVTLRVLFHDTKSSTSLLTHLGIKDTITLLSTFSVEEEPPPGQLIISIPMFLTPDGVKPPFGDTERKDFVPVSQWWTEIIMRQNSNIARRDVILGAANQDGGAHVDVNPSQKTEELIEGIGTFEQRSGGKVIRRENLDNHHFHLIRQFGYEVLNSPDITKYKHSEHEKKI